MHPFNQFLPRLFPVLLVLGAAALIAQLVLDEPAGNEGGEGSEGSEGGNGGTGGEGGEGPRGPVDEEGFQPA